MTIRRIDFKFDKNISKDELENKFSKIGIFDCDEFNFDGDYYDMYTSIGLDDISNEVKENILEYYGDEFDGSVRDDGTFLQIKLCETIFIDEKNYEGYYLISDYITYIAGESGDSQYFDEVKDFEFPQIEKVRKMLEDVGCTLEIDYDEETSKESCSHSNLETIDIVGTLETITVCHECGKEL